MTIWGFHLLDLAVMLGFVLALLYIGIRASKHIKKQEDFFLAGRRFGKLVTTFTNFGQATSSEHATWMVAGVMKNGAPGIMFAIGQGLMVMPIYWFTNRWWRRIRTLTLADFFVERYGSKRMGATFALISVMYLSLLVGLGLNALSKTVCAVASRPVAELSQVEQAEYERAVELDRLEVADLAGLTAAEQTKLQELREEGPRKIFSYINHAWLLAIIVVVVILYSCAGGLEAAALTDTLQGFGIILLSLLLIHFAMFKANAVAGTSGLLGPFEAIQQTVPSHFTKIFGSPGIQQFTWYFLLSFAVMGIVNGLAQPNALASMGASKDENCARVGGVTGNFLKRYCTVAWGLVALLALVLYGGKMNNPDLLWGHMVKDLLGPLGIGLVGLMVVCMLGALMSTADTLMLTSSAMLTHNLYKPLVTGRSEHHYIWAGRGFNVLFLLLSLAVAFYFTGLISMVKFIIGFNSIIGAAFLMGMLWRRATKTAAWVCIGVMLIYTLILPMFLPLIPAIRSAGALMVRTDPVPVQVECVAGRMDVELRLEQIAAWDKAGNQRPAVGARPNPLEVGEKYQRTFKPERKAVFWKGGITTDDNGVRQGKGMLHVDLVVLSKLGWDLSRNPYALNESLRAILRILVPFGVVILFSLLTRPDDKRMLDRFFAKMHTPVTGDKELDNRELALNLENPERTAAARMIPNSNWEFSRWTAYDVKGLAWITVGVAGCIALIWLIVNLGR
ncbi:MAG: sodium:solute symporter family protein [Kiritimatiellia bacterium]|jgi:SSS family solute:Na+ symporter|nr:sodium:solute symporter family protein [Kiritimatiellia bacterium]